MLTYFPGSREFKEKALSEGVKLQLIWGERLMFSLVELSPRSTVPPHSHPHEQMGIVLDGEFEFTIGEETRRVKKGDFYFVPSGIVHSVCAGEQSARALDVFSPPRADYQA
ncbi:MAG: cupin domain-containing protein [Planctomycetes bacterium]|nr:cupin domain-containing protein [Planctomycetota bacterium]